MMNETKSVGTVVTEIESCNDGFRVVMRVFSPQGEEHSRRDMVTESREEAEYAAQQLRLVALQHGARIGTVH